MQTGMDRDCQDKEKEINLLVSCSSCPSLLVPSSLPPEPYFAFEAFDSAALMDVQ
jgi:hypothetical protein